jgi:tripeptide aminopeptidase
MTASMIEQFMAMVQIPSESGEEAAFIDYLVQEFGKLGAEAGKDAYGNLIAKLPAKNSRSQESILFSCHADTVKPGKGIKPVLQDGVIRAGGDTILGADDKAGIAELLEALRVAEKRPPIEIAISRQEEVGLLGVKNLDRNRLSARKGFLLDNDTLDTIIVGGPSYYAIDVTVKGRAAHAGMEPEKGINAIQAAAKAIAALKLGRLDRETTANVGVIQGGLIRNGVPDQVKFLAECRSLKHEKAQKMADKMENTIVAQVRKYGAEPNVQVNNLCRAVSIARNSWTVKLARKALKKLGIDAKPAMMTGYTDASIYNNIGIEMAVVGIGARGEHSLDEHIYVKDMETARDMIVEIMRLSAK